MEKKGTDGESEPLPTMLLRPIVQFYAKCRNSYTDLPS